MNKVSSISNKVVIIFIKIIIFFFKVINIFLNNKLVVGVKIIFSEYCSVSII